MAFHTGQTFTFGETPSAAKMQYIWDNDYALADGTGIEDEAIIARHLADGAVLPKALVAGAGTLWAWQSWTPTFSNFSLGNGTLNHAKYSRVGNLVMCRFRMTLGSTSSMGSDISVSLPVTANSEYVTDTYLGQARLLDAGNAGYHAAVRLKSTTTIGFYGHSNTNPTYGGEYGLGSTAPFSWGNNDAIYGQWMYEAA